jgi:hypothetical protein
MALPGANPLTGLLAGAVAELTPRGGVGLAGLVLLAVAAVTWTSLREPRGVPAEA